MKGKGLLAVLDGHNSLVTGLAFAPNDATTLVSGGRDGVVLVWKLHQPVRFTSFLLCISLFGRHVLIAFIEPDWLLLLALTPKRHH